MPPDAGGKTRGSYNNACDVCSRRKHKCDGNRPVCDPCSKFRPLECSWVNYDNRRLKGEQKPAGDANTVKQNEALRGLLIGYCNYVDNLESLLDRLLQGQGHQPSNMLDFRASRPRDPDNLIGLALNSNTSDLDSTFDPDDLDESDIAEPSPLKTICRGYNQFPLNLEEGFFYGSTAPFRFKKNEPAQSSRFPAIAQHPEAMYVLLVDESTEQHYNPHFEWDRYLPDAVPLDRRSHDKALDISFKYCTTFCLRIIPDLFLRDMCKVLSVPRYQEPPKVTHYSPMLHNSLVALALAFSDDPKFRDLQARKYFVDAAKSYMETECQQPNISVVQALSFLGSFYAAQGDQGLGFLYFGLSARVAQALGLPVDCSEWVRSGLIDESERIDRSWAAWSIFTSDVCWSLYVGRDFSVAQPHPIEFPPFVDPELDNMPIAYGNLPPQPNYITKTFEANCELFIIARSILDVVNGLNRRGARLAVIDELISNMDVKLNTWCRDLAPELQITNKSRLTSTPQKLLLHLSYHWLFILLHRPLFHVKLRSLARTGREIDHVKHCKSASRNIMELLSLWDSLYSLRYSPVTVIQIAFSAGTIFLLNAVQACSGTRIAQKELRSSLDQQAMVMNYLQIVGRSWPGAIKVATILKDLMQDQLQPLLARRKIPIQNGQILQVAKLADEDAEDPPTNTRAARGLLIPGHSKRGSIKAKLPRQVVIPKAVGSPLSVSSPSREPLSPVSQGSPSPAQPPKPIPIPKPKHAIGRSPSPNLGSFEVISPLSGFAEAHASPPVSPEIHHHHHSRSPDSFPAFYDYSHHFAPHHSAPPTFPHATYPDHHYLDPYGGVHNASWSSWPPTTTSSNNAFSSVSGMPGGGRIPQAPFWAPLNPPSDQIMVLDAVGLDDGTLFSSPPELSSPLATSSGSDTLSMHAMTTNNMDIDQTMAELSQWCDIVSQGFVQS